MSTDKEEVEHSQQPEEQGESGIEISSDSDQVEEGLDAEVLPDMIKELPPKERKIFQALIASSHVGPVVSPIEKKINEVHISEAIKFAESRDDRGYHYALTSKKYEAFYFIVVVAALVFFIVFLGKENKELLVQILTVLVAFAGGFGAGLGYGKKQQD